MYENSSGIQMALIIPLAIKINPEETLQKKLEKPCESFMKIESSF